MRSPSHPKLDQVEHEKAPVAFEFELLAVEQPSEHKPSTQAPSNQEIYEVIPKLRKRRMISIMLGIMVVPRRYIVRLLAIWSR